MTWDAAAHWEGPPPTPDELADAVRALLAVEKPKSYEFGVVVTVPLKQYQAIRVLLHRHDVSTGRSRPVNATKPPPQAKGD